MSEELTLHSAVQLDARDETVRFFFRKHWIHFLKILLNGTLIGLLTAVVILALYILVSSVSAPVLRAAFVFTVMIGTFVYMNLFLLEVISYFFDLVIVTDHRIIVAQKTVFLRNDSGAIDLTKIQDLSVQSHGLLSNYLQYGRILITLSASIPPVVLPCVPRPHDYLERTNRIKREHILRRQEGKVKSSLARTPRELSQAYLQDVRQLLEEGVAP